MRCSWGECAVLRRQHQLPGVARRLARSLRPRPRRRARAATPSASHEALAAIDPALLPRAPLLAVPLGLELPDTELTATLRREAAQDLARGPAGDVPARPGAAEPLLIVLEDCHWLDPLSRDLLEAVGTPAVRRCRCSWCSPTGPRRARARGLGLASLPGATEVPLTALEDAEMAVLIEARLGGATGSDGLPRPGDGPRPGQPVLRRGAAQLRAAPGHRRRRRARRSPRSTCPTACAA